MQKIIRQFLKLRRVLQRPAWERYEVPANLFWMYYGKSSARQPTCRSCRRLRIAVCQTDPFRSLRQRLQTSVPSTRKPVRCLQRWQDRNRMDNIDSRCNRFSAPLFSCDATPAAWRLLHLKGLFFFRSQASTCLEREPVKRSRSCRVKNYCS
jgi:hypothetical protein